MTFSKDLVVFFLNYYFVPFSGDEIQAWNIILSCLFLMAFMVLCSVWVSVFLLLGRIPTVFPFCHIKDMDMLHFLKFPSQNDHRDCRDVFQLGVQIALYAKPVYSNSETLCVS